MDASTPNGGRTKGISMGGSYLLVGYLQPSELGTLGWLVAIAALASERYLICGIAAAAGGALHANYLVLGIGLFTLTAIARRHVSLRDHAKILVPQLVVLAFFAPSLFAAAGVNEKALWILTHFHAPVLSGGDGVFLGQRRAGEEGKGKRSDDSIQHRAPFHEARDAASGFRTGADIFSSPERALRSQKPG